MYFLHSREFGLLPVFHTTLVLLNSIELSSQGRKFSHCFGKTPTTDAPPYSAPGSSMESTPVAESSSQSKLLGRCFNKPSTRPSTGSRQVSESSSHGRLLSRNFDKRSTRSSTGSTHGSELSSEGSLSSRSFHSPPTSPSTGSTQVSGACRFPEIPMNSIEIETNDGSVFHGQVTTDDTVLPIWLRRDAPVSWDFINWIVTAQNERFRAIIKVQTPLPHFDPSKDRPQWVYIRIGEKRYISARNFERYYVNKHDHNLASGGVEADLPANNCMYTSIKYGSSAKVYSSVIHDYTEV